MPSASSNKKIISSIDRIFSLINDINEYDKKISNKQPTINNVNNNLVETKGSGDNDKNSCASESSSRSNTKNKNSNNDSNNTHLLHKKQVLRDFNTYEVNLYHIRVS